MIIKSMARKSASFRQLLSYIDASEKVGSALLHNLRSERNDQAAISREFNANGHLLPPRKNGNLLYHEVLSFAAEDGESTTPSVLEDLTRRYLELRAPYALAYAKAHFDTDCPHVHLMISANEVGSHRRLRLSKARFRTIQKQLEKVQRELYPQLEHSVAQKPRSIRRKAQPSRRRSSAEEEMKRRLTASGEGRMTRKEVVRDLVSSELTTATSGPDCYRRLLTSGLELYRRGSSIGVRDTKTGRRYRLKTLGLSENFDRAFASWQEIPQRLQQLSPSESKHRQLDHER